MGQAGLSAAGDDVPALLRALVEGGSVSVPVAVADKISRIRSGQPTIVSFGINERRVDAVVDSAGEQYRIVYFTNDGGTIASLSVFRRPPLLEPLAGGHVVVVNGPSSAGKSSVLAALADRSQLPWVVFDEPVVGVVDQSYLIWREQSPQLHRGFLDAIAALARRGNRVALSAAGHPAALIDEVFADVPTTCVGLDCDVETLLEREWGRDGRWGGLAAASVSVHDGWIYDVRFDTAAVAATDIALAILQRVT